MATVTTKTLASRAEAREPAGIRSRDKRAASSAQATQLERWSNQPMNGQATFRNGRGKWMDEISKNVMGSCWSVSHYENRLCQYNEGYACADCVCTLCAAVELRLARQLPIFVRVSGQRNAPVEEEATAAAAAAAVLWFRATREKGSRGNQRWAGFGSSILKRPEGLFNAEYYSSGEVCCNA